jgi:hypothetical protein
MPKTEISSPSFTRSETAYDDFVKGIIDIGEFDRWD